MEVCSTCTDTEIHACLRLPDSQALPSIMARGASVIAACVNLQSLTIRTSGDQQPLPLFDHLLSFQLRLPALRHIFLSFNLAHKSLTFVECHSEQLESLSIYMAGNLVNGHSFCRRALCTLYSIPLTRFILVIGQNALSVAQYYPSCLQVFEGSSSIWLHMGPHAWPPFSMG